MSLGKWNTMQGRGGEGGGVSIVAWMNEVVGVCNGRWRGKAETTWAQAAGLENDLLAVWMTMGECPWNAGTSRVLGEEPNHLLLACLSNPTERVVWPSDPTLADSATQHQRWSSLHRLRYTTLSTKRLSYLHGSTEPFAYPLIRWWRHSWDFLSVHPQRADGANRTRTAHYNSASSNGPSLPIWSVRLNLRDKHGGIDCYYAWKTSNGT